MATANTYATFDADLFPHSDWAVASLPPLPVLDVESATRGRPTGCRMRRSHRRKPGSLVEQFVAENQPLVQPAGQQSLAYRVAKRTLDIVGALALLMVLGPVMLAVLLVLLVTTRGKPFFTQRRAGYLGRTFMLIKFRTMRLDAEKVKQNVKNEKDGPIFKNRRDPRITRLGRFLRKTSLDETPQLIHVLLGQMSLVGPRPLDIREVVRFSAWQRQRLAVVPGLTCLWQISGRSEIGLDDWARMDLWYVRNQSFWTDCKLLLHTPLSVLSCRGAY